MFITIEPELTQPLTWEQFYPHSIYYQIEHHGYRTHGTNYLENAKELWPALFVAVFLFFARAFCKTHIFNALGRSYGIKSPAKLSKFGYQFWLAIAYTSSSIYGIVAFRSESYFKWPIDHAASVSLWEDVPATNWMWAYYWWGLGFYTAELFAIFVEPKRSDFVEYVVHHITTVTLMVLSASSDNLHFGGMILILHDLTDIFLCFAKIFHYCKNEVAVNINFVLFMASMAYLRLYCLPALVESAFFQATNIRGAELTHWICGHLLLVLLALHCYWMYLTVKMVFRLLSGVHGDVRSDSDEEEKEKKK